MPAEGACLSLDGEAAESPPPKSSRSAVAAE
eukprot:CAMPEP_0198212290 /NCGR_PEP_ID=MMETSP1445-20131203/25629_1 /TAXON_ID=36898 /ORGANISM="Pyramimonas sp., Strain CCMP2087" /LENGTH=30 /DNA_ID= /DNA_START= /DNA_END= /DNA_ORIENTATION=